MVKFEHRIVNREIWMVIMWWMVDHGDHWWSITILFTDEFKVESAQWSHMFPVTPVTVNGTVGRFWIGWFLHQWSCQCLQPTNENSTLRISNYQVPLLTVSMMIWSFIFESFNVEIDACNHSVYRLELWLYYNLDNPKPVDIDYSMQWLTARHETPQVRLPRSDSSTFLRWPRRFRISIMSTAGVTQSHKLQALLGDTAECHWFLILIVKIDLP